MAATSSMSYPPDLRLSSLVLADGGMREELGLNASWRAVDESRVLGTGEECFQRASANLLEFRAHRYAGVRVRRDPVDPDVVWLRVGPTLSPCRILHVERTPQRTALVYGTLPGHVECGEEAFLIEHRADGSVVGRCVAFSRPERWFARLAPHLAAAAQSLITRRYLAGMAKQE
ncbi:DUF1990 domain-containing protein [Corynebacterium sp. CMW7794]|uniref:DUF1990 domain-containing protein n=1 Tax=Corynebacterium sp. CMW7794 TaxID=1603887 RepID=UPI001E53B99B|nr:DUF1990 domain-containing protein [Corynebacterium sp. CMW7794]